MLFMVIPHQFLGKEHIFSNTSLWHKSCLLGANETIQNWQQPISKYLSDAFIHNITMQQEMGQNSPIEGLFFLGTITIMVALTAFNSIPVLKKVCTATTKSLPVTGHAFWKKEAVTSALPVN